MLPRRAQEMVMMQRKQWAGGTVLMSFLLAAGTAWGGEIQYIRPAIPAFELPQYEGQRYEVLVPDTLDLQERGALCLACADCFVAILPVL